MAWLALIVGGLFEVGFTTCLRFVDGFRAPGWTAGFLVSAGLSMMLLERAARGGIPMGTAYAVWGGIGAVGTVMVGIVGFGEPLGAARMLLIAGIVICIAGLRLAAKGVDKGRMEAKSGGESNPTDTNATAQGQAENRRTELVVTAK